ncbi:alpha/beta hydrolase [Actinotalea sp.]|uniref:alpha/beta hydrolase n=1 Tax=Actinotalea sp. TaxID=1872145 RepID=UPI003568003D
MPWLLLTRLAALIATALVVGFAAGSALVHAHPAYPALLAVTLLLSLVALLRAVRRGRRASPGASGAGPATEGAARGPSLRRRTGRVLAAVGVVVWLGVLAWLRPLGAVQPALEAMTSGPGVEVVETATWIELRPSGEGVPTALLFQPGAKVDARAYAAVLRPLAASGVLVVVPKQPLGIAFLAVSAFERARAAHPEVESWVVGGHSLGGTVAAMDADAHDEDGTAPVVGLLLYASYPASDLSASLDAAVLSISGSRDGLSTPAEIDDSRALLPPAAELVEIEGASHASFGDYGQQSGDGVPTLPADEARARIAELTTGFVASLVDLP